MMAKIESSPEGKGLMQGLKIEKAEKALRKVKSQIKKAQTEMAMPKSTAVSASNVYIREQLKGTTGEVGEKMKVVSSQWAKLSENEKAKFENIAKEESQKRAQEYEAWATKMKSSKGMEELTALESKKKDLAAKVRELKKVQKPAK